MSKPTGNKQIPLKIVDDGGMYESAPKVYSREIDGRFQNLRLVAVWVLLGLYYVTRERPFDIG